MTPEWYGRIWLYPELSNDLLSLLFQSAIESTEEAIYNSLCMAQTMTGTGGVTIAALPFSVVEKKILKHNKEKYEHQQG